MEKIIGEKDFIKVGCVSFETAKSLKPFYNKICNFAWYKTEQIKPEYDKVYGEYYPDEIMDEFPDKYNDIVETVYGLHQFTSRNKDEYPNLYTAPLLFDVIRYFINEHHIHVSTYWDNSVNKWSWYSELMDCPDQSGIYQSKEHFDTMEEALDSGIKFVSTNLIMLYRYSVNKKSMP